MRGVEAAVYFAIAALLDTFMGLRLSPQVLRGALLDPDSYMRLDRLRDILARHAPLHVVLRDASGAGALLHWSHLLDSLLLLLALPLRLFLNQPEALHVAAVLIGPLGVGLLGIAVAWVMAPFADRQWRWTAPTLAALAPPIIGYGLPGVAHHHILLALAAVMMAGSAGRAAEGDRVSGCRLGAWAGAAIWLSPEAMPFVLMAFGGGGLAWMMSGGGHGRAAQDHAVADALATAGSLFFLVVACAFAVDPPMAGFGAVEIDRLSVVYLALAAIICVIFWVTFGLDRAGVATAWRPGGVVATAGLVLWFALFPAVLHGPDGLMDAETTRAFFGIIQEMRPVASVAQAFGLLLDGMLAAVLLAWLAFSRRSLLAGYAATCVGVMLVLGLQHVRFATYGATAAAAALPVMLTECTRLLKRRSQALQAASRIGLIALMLVPNRAYTALGGAQADDWDVPATGPGTPDCGVGSLGPFLAPYAGHVVLTNVNDVPELLYRTGILTVGSLYYTNAPGLIPLRSAAGFMRLRAAWRSLPSQSEPEAVRATGATFVLVCPRAGAPGRWSMVRDLPEQSLLDQLERGEVPPWLRAVAWERESGHILYAIMP